MTDAVVAARILMQPLLAQNWTRNLIWKDDSNFSEIFDVDWFISYLAKDVEIIKELPQIRGQMWTPYMMRVPRKCSERCYINRLLPVLLKKHAIQLTKFDYTVSNKLEIDLQKLRCRVNYHALKFTSPILEMDVKLVQRMRNKSKVSSHFTYVLNLICLHSPDAIMVKETKRGGNWGKYGNRNPDRERRQGRCPLTPEEVGLMLRALGYDRETHIYMASGEVYGGEETMVSLKALFPNYYSKDTLASKEELEPFSAFSSRMAALDFIVCDESHVFVTNDNGNMAKIIAGPRR